MMDQIGDSFLVARRRAYDTDLTEEEWSLVRSLIETQQLGPGPRRSVNLREVLNALLYKQRTGCQWRMLPHDLPPRSTVSGYYQRWTKSGVLEQVQAILRRYHRENETRLVGSNVLIQQESLSTLRSERQRQTFIEA